MFSIQCIFLGGRILYTTTHRKNVRGKICRFRNYVTRLDPGCSVLRHSVNLDGRVSSGNFKARFQRKVRRTKTAKPLLAIWTLFKTLPLPESSIKSIDVLLKFKSVDETLVCDHSNESYRAVLSCYYYYYAIEAFSYGTLCFSLSCKIKFGIFSIFEL